MLDILENHEKTSKPRMFECDYLLEQYLKQSESTKRRHRGITFCQVKQMNPM